MSGNGRQLTIGILGAGAVSQNYHLPVLAHHDDVRVAWICDKDAARVPAELARAAGVPASYARLELEDLASALSRWRAAPTTSYRGTLPTMRYDKGTVMTRKSND